MSAANLAYSSVYNGHGARFAADALRVFSKVGFSRDFVKLRFYGQHLHACSSTHGNNIAFEVGLGQIIEDGVQVIRLGYIDR